MRICFNCQHKRIASNIFALLVSKYVWREMRKGACLIGQEVTKPIHVENRLWRRGEMTARSSWRVSEPAEIGETTDGMRAAIHKTGSERG